MCYPKWFQSFSLLLLNIAQLKILQKWFFFKIISIIIIFIRKIVPTNWGLQCHWEISTRIWSSNFFTSLNFSVNCFTSCFLMVQFFFLIFHLENFFSAKFREIPERGNLFEVSWKIGLFCPNLPTPRGLRGKKMFRRVKRIGYFLKNLSTYVSMLFKSKQPV